MSGSEFLGEEETGGFDDDIDTQSTPGDVGGILLGEDLDLVAINDQIVAIDFDVVVEVTVDGVILQHVSQIISIEEVVDTDNLNVFREILDGGTEYHTADAAESVNTKFYHFL